MMDSGGIRALVRGHTTAQRLGGSLRLAAMPAAVRQVLEESRLSSIFDTYESVEGARLAAWPWQKVRVLAAGAALCTTLVWVGLKWPQLAGLEPITQRLLEPAQAASAPAPCSGSSPSSSSSKLVAAALIGALVTADPSAGSAAIGRARSSRRRRCSACRAR